MRCIMLSVGPIQLSLVLVAKHAHLPIAVVGDEAVESRGNLAQADLKIATVTSFSFSSEYVPCT